MTRCIRCGGRRLVRRSVPEALTVDGVRFAGDVPALVCVGCDEAYVSGETLERLELVAAGWLATAGRRTPGSFRFIRNALGLRGADLGALLGTTPETVSRWENGKHEIDAAAFAVLGSLVADRLDGREDTLERLRAMREPARAPSRGPVRLRVA